MFSCIEENISSKYVKEFIKLLNKHDSFEEYLIKKKSNFFI